MRWVTTLAADSMVQFAVVLKESEWAVLKDGQVQSHGMSRSDAIRQAQQQAFEVEESEDVEILIQGYTGELHARYSGPG